MGFPDETDRLLQRQAEEVLNLTTDVYDWLSEFNRDRAKLEMLPISERDEFQVLQLRRLARSIFTSSKVPVAAAVYGPSQVGKSLFMGAVLRPQSHDYSPLGRDEALGEPSYYKDLSFDTDLNPQSGSNEATALVTRFTTKERMAEGPSPEFPVMVKALTRAEWLRVLARGFHGECRAEDSKIWDENNMETMVSQIAKVSPGKEVDSKWRMDIMDAFSYMTGIDRRGFPCKSALLNSILSRYPLSDEGYTQVVANLFWGNWSSMTGLFTRINAFLERLYSPDHDPCILTHWAGVRFLLDSQRSKFHDRPTSKVWKRVEWSDFQLKDRSGWMVLEYNPGSGNGREDLETMQAAMLELVLPILPHRLNDDWRQVIENMDFLDIPGMRAGRQGTEAGKRTSADTVEEQMEIVKRGKVSYLFERCTEERQIQTLMLLSRGGNLEVSNQMKDHINKWGRTRYGDRIWPRGVTDDTPALFVGMTGIDDEFRNREIYADKSLYEARLGQLADALDDVFNDFGGKGKPFTNAYPIRYPGTWDTNEAMRQKNDPIKWDKAKEAFMASDAVARYVRDKEHRWDIAMTDGDGGQSLIAAGIHLVTSSTDKQNQLQQEINRLRAEILQLSRAWYVDPDANVDREKRIKAGNKMVNWLTEDPQSAYDKIYALQNILTLQDGAEAMLADCAEIKSKRHGDPLPDTLRAYLSDWAKKEVPRRYNEYIKTHKFDEFEWLDPEDMGTFVRYLQDYLTCEKCITALIDQLDPVIHLKTRDESARRRARRKYTQIIMNDYIMNPGPSWAAIKGQQLIVDGDEVHEDDSFIKPLEAYADYGLAASFTKRWVERVPQALAAGAGDHVQIPPGNSELWDILAPFEGRY